MKSVRAAAIDFPQLEPHVQISRPGSRVPSAARVAGWESGPPFSIRPCGQPGLCWLSVCL